MARMNGKYLAHLERRAAAARAAGDPATALRLLRRQAWQGSVGAFSRVGTVYERERVPPRPSRAIYWYRQGVRRGDEICAWNLATLHAMAGHRRKYQRWLRAARAMGDDAATEELSTGAWWRANVPPHAAREEFDFETGRLFRDADDAESLGDLPTAMRLFERAVRRGDRDACARLGTLFGDLLEPPQPDRAVRWYRRGLRQGSASCAWNLAMHYAGVGQRSNYARALRCARDLGDADAVAELATGKWWRRRNPIGASAVRATREEDLNQTLRRALAAEAANDPETAIRLYKRAARLGEQGVFLTIGRLYARALQPPRPDRAVHWYRRGVQGGNQACVWDLVTHHAWLGHWRGYRHWLGVADRMGDGRASWEIHDRRLWQRSNAQPA